MYNFPLPYPDELIYSLIARAGVHSGQTSPKCLIDEVFNNRKVIASVDLPCHLVMLRRQLPDRPEFDCQSLSYNNTLLPLYAPFTRQENLIKCLKEMKGQSQGSVHLRLGVVASRLKQESFLRYCPQCQQKQLSCFGEYYWPRLWQVTGISSCPDHGKLISSPVNYHSSHRHQYFHASPYYCPNELQISADKESHIISKQVKLLLNRPFSQSANFNQWSRYYKGLAIHSNCCNGNNIDHTKVLQKILITWDQQWLYRYGLVPKITESSWLRSIFRKHRKSFSYLENIIVLQAFLGNDWNINAVLEEVSRQNSSAIEKLTSKSFSCDDNIEKRKLWLNLVKKYGTKMARSIADGGALYSWLYRHDQDWLLSVNKQYRLKVPVVNNRVNWTKRDLLLVRQFFRIKKQVEQEIETPRRSRNWYLKQLKNNSSIEKNLNKLPLCKAFFSRNVENISSYQIRRLKLAKKKNTSQGKQLVRWKLLRFAGLSDERITKVADLYLTKITRPHG